MGKGRNDISEKKQMGFGEDVNHDPSSMGGTGLEKKETGTQLKRGV